MSLEFTLTLRTPPTSIALVDSRCFFLRCHPARPEEGRERGRIVGAAQVQDRAPGSTASRAREIKQSSLGQRPRSGRNTSADEACPPDAGTCCFLFSWFDDSLFILVGRGFTAT